MNYCFDSESQLPQYMQLYNMFVRDIVNGSYEWGCKLPSKRTIAAETGASVITVQHALALLSDEGYIASRERSGYFVIYKEADFMGRAAEAARYEGEAFAEPSVAQTAIGDGNYIEFPYSVMAKTMRKVLLDYGESILVKSPSKGSVLLRKEICAYLGRSRGLSVLPEEVVLGAGAEYLYGLVAQLLSSRGDFALEDPSYEKIHKVYEAMGITCHKLPLYSDGIASSDLNSTNARVLHVTPFNSFPSGVSISISKKRSYLEWAQSCDGIIIEDNYDSELTVSMKPEDSLFSLDDSSRVIYINTFTKTIAPSIRIGYMVLPKHLLAEFEEKLGFYSCTVPVFEQYVLLELLKSGDYERHINRVRRKRRKSTLE